MSNFRFTEQTPRETGFRQVFNTRIVPILERHEKTRKEYRRKALTGMGLTGTGTVGALGAGVNFESEFGLFGGVVGGMGTYGVKAYYESKWKAGLGGEVLPILCDFMGEMEYGQQRIDMAAMLELGVIPNYDTSSLEDPVIGKHDGLDWYMTEAKLQTKTRDSKGKTRTNTVFRGLLFMISINGPAPRIFFGKDRGGALNWLSETFSSSRVGLEKLALNDREFEQVYETYSSDANAARAYIDPRLRAGLLEVARVEGGKKYIACAMEGDWMYLALPRSGDFLGLGSLFSPLSAIESDLHEAIADLDLPARVIDRLKGN